MKKFVFIFLAILSNQASAQETEREHSLALVAGLNWIQPLVSNIDGAPSYDTRTGFSAGVDYTLHLTTRWHLKAGIHYSNCTYDRTVGPLYWPSEYSTGQYVYDPTLPHFVTERINRYAFQYLLGIRYAGRGTRWRFFADAESGITNIEQDNVDANSLRLHLGAGAGVSWNAPGDRLAIFMEPVVRFVFPDFRAGSLFEGGNDQQFLIPALEAGVRHHF